MDHISIILVHYNADKDTRECLESLVKIDTKDFKYSVVVIDNASKKPFTLPKSLLEKNVEIVRSEANLGFTGGNNLGIKYAIEKYNSEFVLLLNTDTLVAPNFLVQLYECAKNSPKPGFFTPKIYFAKGYEYHQQSYLPQQRGKVLWYAGGSIDWRNLSSSHRGVDEVDRGQFDHQLASDFSTGCCVLISREALEAVGLFDKAFFLYWEDVDLSIRASKRGYLNAFCPSSIIWHKNAGTTGGSGSHVHTYYQTRNRIWIAFKHGVARTKLLALTFGFRKLLKGETYERRAVLDLILGRLGKQPII